MISVSNEVPDTVQQANAMGVHASLPLDFFLERYEQSYVEEMKAFVEALLEDREPPVTGLDGRIPVLMGYAAIKSLQENRPVSLSEVDR
jgi:myo-inositol 2-dehydrogenase/D-chiro-inositol 1-dehydrogenase